VKYTNAEGNLMYNDDFYASKEFFYYDNGNISDIYYNGIDGKRCLGPEGYAHARILYEDNGFTQEIDYYDQNDYPVITTFGMQR
jgi:hypothetical protein